MIWCGVLWCGVVSWYIRRVDLWHSPLHTCPLLSNTSMCASCTLHPLSPPTNTIERTLSPTALSVPGATLWAVCRGVRPQPTLERQDRRRQTVQLHLHHLGDCRRRAWGDDRTGQGGGGAGRGEAANLRRHQHLGKLVRGYTCQEEHVQVRSYCSVVSPFVLKVHWRLLCCFGGGDQSPSLFFFFLHFFFRALFLRSCLVFFLSSSCFAVLEDNYRRYPL